MKTFGLILIDAVEKLRDILSHEAETAESEVPTPQTIMKLLPITVPDADFEQDMDQDNDLRGYYARWPKDTGDLVQWGNFGAMMAALVTYLEDEVEAPAQWAHTSHGELVLSDHDTWGKGRVWINAFPKPDEEVQKYEIRYSVTDSIYATAADMVVSSTEDVEVAAKMVLEALELAAKRE